MSEVQRSGANQSASRASAINEAKKMSGAIGAGIKAANAKKNVPVGEKKANKTDILPEPKHPDLKTKTYTIRENELVGYIAERYNISMSEVEKANPGVNLDKVKPGQQIKIPYYDPKEMEVYNEKYAAYSKQQREIRHAQEVKERKAIAENKIAEANKQGWGPYYSFSVNSEGYIIVKPLDKQKLAEIRKDLGLPPGHLDANNSLESKYGPIPTVNDGTRDVETWDNIKTKVGDTFVIDPKCMNTERTWGQAFKDFWNSIF